MSQILEKEKIPKWDGTYKWESSTIHSMLKNEKYKGDAILQKSYTADFLTKKRNKNLGELQSYYIEDDHEAIIDKDIWECVQLEMERREKYLQEYGLNSYSRNTESNPLASKIICGNCNKPYSRKGWQSRSGETRRIWQCSQRYKVKGVQGCTNRHTDEETLIKAFLMAWNAILDNREACFEKWNRQKDSDNLLEAYRAEQFIEYTEDTTPVDNFETDFMLKVLDHIKVFEDGMLEVVFLDGTKIECR